MGKIKSLVGKKFGSLTVLKLDHIERKECKCSRLSKGYYIKSIKFYLCKCDCGKECVKNAFYLNEGCTRSCGCLVRANPSKNFFKHGHTNTKLYGVWCGIKRRCYCKTGPKYIRYGGRGITVCDEWRDDFMAFYNWAMANGYKEGLTIDRINNDGNYEPNNCRWVTAKEQANNRSTNIFIKHEGERKTIASISQQLRINSCTLRKRFAKFGLNEKIFEKDLRRKRNYNL